MIDFFTTDDELRNLPPDERQMILSELMKMPAMTDKLNIDHPAARRLFNLIHGIDKESRQRRKDAASAESAISLETRKEIAIIEKSKPFMDHLHKDHRAAHKAWLKLFKEPQEV